MKFAISIRLMILIFVECLSGQQKKKNIQEDNFKGDHNPKNKLIHHLHRLQMNFLKDDDQF